jgi:hypothetical protein
MTRRMKFHDGDGFVYSVTDFVHGLGARPGSFYDYELDTPAGLLHLSVHDGWLATRFDDVAMGTKFTESCGRPSNPFSGKWNFHYAESYAVEAILAELFYWFRLLMRWEPDPRHLREANNQRTPR